MIKLKLIIFFIIFIFLVVLYNGWVCRYDFGSENRSCDKTNSLTKDGIHYKTNFLDYEDHQNLKNKLVKDYNVNTVLLNKDDYPEIYNKIITYCKYVTKSELQPVCKSDERQMWIRYYDENVTNPYEAFHIDRKRYKCDAKQYRAVYCIYSNSDGKFIANEHECKIGTTEIPTQENSLMIIEAENLIHSLHLTSGRRIMLMCDFTSSVERGLHGTLVWIWDMLWMNIQKIITKK